MSKTLKINLIVLLMIILILFIFFLIDYNRVANNEKPIFYVSVTTYKDGGTREYLGLSGYKVIAFNKLGGYNETKFGSWFMKYSDFDEEIQKYEDERKQEVEQNLKQTLNNIVKTQY